MAQLVARLVRNEKVGGSNPPSSTIEDVLELLTSVDVGSGVRAARGSASRIVAQAFEVFLEGKAQALDITA